MRFGYWQVTIVGWFLVLIVVGCAAPKMIPIDVQNAVSKAGAYLDMVEESGGKDISPDDYQTAAEKYRESQLHLENYDVEAARNSAQESLQASQTILQRIYSDVMIPILKKAKDKIEKMQAEDPETPLKNLLPRTNELLAYSERVVRGEEIIAIDRVLADLGEVLDLEHEVETSGTFSLTSDISFDTGKYTLSDQGRQILDETFQRILDEQRAYLEQSPQKIVTINITVDGYTDQQGFKSATTAEKRKVLNQRLSEQRAQTISDYIGQILGQANSARLFSQQTVTGRGEELPPGVSSGTINDPLRRICRITVYIEVE